ncbi:hypothetical protein F4804DRAFT_314796 [Jackrogersella minutella]|nr:hypothetical protein F4804DRAFT_314796 [Jackrogersella minutella]
MAELYRVAQGTIRATSILRSSTSRWPSSISPASSIPNIRQISSKSILRPIQASDRRSPISQIQYQNYATASWPSRAREPRAEQTEIKKPNIQLYEDDYLAPELDFDTGELNKNSKIYEAREAPARPALRLVPRLGRTVHVGKTVDVARSFTLLNIQVAQNRIKNDFHAQRFHERPGLKRKNNKCKRWRLRFKRGFKACVSRVKELTKQGW